MMGKSDNTELTKKARELLRKQVDRKLAAALETCVRCGICAESCHYYVADPRPEHVPAYRAEKLRQIYRGLFDPIGRIAPGWVGAVPVSDQMLDSLVETSFASCTMCRRCTVNCPMGVDNALVVRAIRSLLTATGRAPEMLEQLAEAAIMREEGLEYIKDLFLEQIAELENELREKVGDLKARIPVEEQGAEILYVALSGAHTILPASVLFYATGTSWSLSLFEAANYGVFLGDTPRAKRITQRIVDEATRLGVKEVVVSECGHAYTTLRWEAPNWFGKPFPFRVRSLVEVMAEWIEKGKLKLDPTRNRLAVTYHDSCNLARNSGLIEEPRTILNACVTDFREMTPNKQHNYCCGGGAGLVALPEFSEQRLNAGKPKVKQIKATGASIVAASCDNCRHQLGELNEHYEMGVEVIGLAELVVNALVLDKGRVPGKEPVVAATV
ncbi:MAG: (Fe-S)-binding protein [Chloroflexi bacterium]|nr:(Fe-S)-binding protein [Chloroflexota bacterium]